MNDERLGQEIGDFYRQTDVTPPDSQQSAREVAGRLPQVEQVKRRRWRPSWLAWAPGESSPIPAPHGHTPTVIGRTQSMLSPAKAITAGALVFALGGVMLITQPFQHGANAPGAATDAGLAAPVEVTGTSVLVGCPDAGTTEDLGTFERTIGGTCQTKWTMSDERLSGTGTMVANEDNYTDGSALTFGIHSLTIENDEGGWRMRPGYWLGSPDTPDAFSLQLWVLDGEDAYEGLTAVLFVEDLGNPHGFIFENELPPAPENASTK